MQSDGEGHHPVTVALHTFNHLPFVFLYGQRHAYPPQMQVLLLVSRSVITHLIVPGGLCKVAVPAGGKLPPDRLINTRRSSVLCSIL